MSLSPSKQLDLENQDDDQGKAGKEVRWSIDESADGAKDAVPKRASKKHSKTKTVPAAPKNESIFKRKKKLLLTILLVVANVCYLLIGGYLFHVTEDDYIRGTRGYVKDYQENFNNRLLEVFEVEGDEAETERLLSETMKNFTKGIRDYVLKHGFDGGKQNDTIPNWTFSAAILYCVVVVTCIGYGDTTPSSENGRLLTVIYALIGIPLILLMIHKLSERISLGFKLSYYNITKVTDKTKEKIDKIKSKHDKKLSDDVEKGGQEDETNNAEPEETEKEPKENAPVTVKKINLKEILIPIHVSICILIGYTLLGGLIFTVWEEDWTFSDSLYFSFISLTTIGFGDLVFGKCDRAEDEDCEVKLANAKLTISCLYIIFGLAVVAMCFNLMLQTFKTNFRDFGVKFGLIAAYDDAPTRLALGRGSLYD